MCCCSFFNNLPHSEQAIGFLYFLRTLFTTNWIISEIYVTNWSSNSDGWHIADRRVTTQHVKFSLICIFDIFGESESWI
ncbi:hypothetical protein BpHYR1_010546 [Brachionus plicatilis]|uniref:Uncharacterized protein n=1 Tax=Brachionus plicatilis TaxID=10195 RepID=A0A3M7T8J7_BRAPC|nr:hypothetical protein BpHYR1_010546 [Brachionus plicatilis]